MNSRKITIKLLGTVAFVSVFGFSLNAMYEGQNKEKRVSFKLEKAPLFLRKGSSKLTDNHPSGFVNKAKKEKNNLIIESSQSVNEKIWREKEKQNTLIINKPVINKPNVEISVDDSHEYASWEETWEKNSFIINTPKSFAKPSVFSGSGNYDFDLVVNKNSSGEDYKRIINSNDSSSFAQTMRLADKIIEAQSQMLSQQQLSFL